MIFNKDFDRSLWLILVSDKRRRMKIVDFINRIPKEILDKIRYFLEQYFSIDDNVDTKKFNKAMRDSLGNTYLYNVEMNKKELTIKFSKWGQSMDQDEETYELNLISLSLNEIKEKDFSNSIYLGTYYYNNVSLFLETIFAKCDGYFYYTYFDEPEQNVIVEICGDRIKRNSIDLNMIPDDINLSDLEDRRSVNKLVRGRKIR